MAHLEAALHEGHYLKGTVGQGIHLKSNPDLQVSVYCDADWDTFPLTHRALTVYVVLFSGSPVSWKTKKHDIIYHSSDEEEYHSMFLSTKEIYWLRHLLGELKFTSIEPFRIFCNS